MKKIIVTDSTMSANMEHLYDKFEDLFGFGPCGAYSAYLRQQGYGDVAVCTATSSDGAEFPHYVLVEPTHDTIYIMDYTNPFDEPLTYNDIEILSDHEMPEMVDQKVVDWIAANVN